MAGIGHTVAHELVVTKCKLEEANRHLEAARAEITNLRDEVARLRQHALPELKREPRWPSQNTSTPRSRDTAIPSSIPRYARATQASEKRSANPKTATQRSTTTVPPVTSKTRSTDPDSSPLLGYTKAPLADRYQHREGCSFKAPMGYLRATRSSVAKLRSKFSIWTVGSEATSSETQSDGTLTSSWGDADVSGSWTTVSNDERWTTYEIKHGRSWSLGWLHDVELSPLEMSDTEYKDLVDLHALVPATRLEDDKWRVSPLKHMSIDDATQADLLIRGRQIAQKCLWNFAERRLAGKNPWTSWQQVRFEWGVLSQSWGTASTYYSLLNFRATGARTVWETIQRVIQLRHTTSHYSTSTDLFPSSLGEVDEHLKNVQKLAIHLYDEQSALATRKLRDELREAAQNTFDEITALSPLIALPFAGYPWKHQHEFLFRRLLFNAQNADEHDLQSHDKLPEHFGRLAEDWLLKHGWMGSGYEPPFSLPARCREPPRRRHSAFSHQSSGTVAEILARVRADWKWHQQNGNETPNGFLEVLVDTHEQDAPVASSRLRRRQSC